MVMKGVGIEGDTVIEGGESKQGGRGHLEAGSTWIKRLKHEEE